MNEKLTIFWLEIDNFSCIFRVKLKGSSFAGTENINFTYIWKFPDPSYTLKIDTKNINSSNQDKDMEKSNKYPFKGYLRRNSPS